MPDNNENEVLDIDNLTIPASGLLVDFQAEAREQQRMFDEALVQTVIRVIRENAELRRELREALGIED